MNRNKYKIKKILLGGKIHIGIVVADFNNDITERLLDGAERTLLQSGVVKNNITVIHVPGGFEIPILCQRLAMTKKYDALIALGTVIKGDTDHYYYISSEASRGIMQVMLTHNIPIGFGVLTTNTVTQARKRSGVKYNAGVLAADAVLNIVDK